MGSRRTQILCLISCVGIGIAFLLYFFLLQTPRGLPSFEQIRAAQVRSDSILLDRYGEVIHELRTDKQARRLEWTSLQEISPALLSAIIVGEDHRFYQHHGVDWISFGAAVLGLIRPSQPRGASTITMQLAAQLDESLQPYKIGRTLLQKSGQIRAAQAYEKFWSKNQILEAYLNLVSFRGELQGVAAASRGLFGKKPQGLKDTEGVIMAALVRSPNADVGSVEKRARALAAALHVSTSGLQETIRASLDHPYFVRPQIALASHVAYRLFELPRNAGHAAPGRLSCTLDGRLQAFAAETLRYHVLSASSQNMHDGAALVVDNNSGDVLAYVGNIGNQSSARFVDGVQAARQAGSALKPFVYALAFENRLLTPVSLIADSPLDIPVQGGIYRPKNYDNRFHGLVTARVALASSLNVPAVKTLNLVGVDLFVEKLRQLGFRDIGDPEMYGPSLALGSADVSLWDLVNAYRSLANGGVWSPLRLTAEQGQEPMRQIVSAESAFLIGDILSDRESRSRTFALESPLSTRFWTAVKTGTSKDMRDNWCVGFSDRYTVGIWAGNFSGEPMWDVSGITGAAPVWVEIMNWLHGSRSSRKPAPPAGLVRTGVEIINTGHRQEWFLKGTEMSIVELPPDESAKIVYPAAGTIVALDPDIPSDAQKMFFEASPKGKDFEWWLDDRSLGSAADLISWEPEKGRHVLKLLDQRRRELDSVRFEVRGNVQN
jgi:penicillin-binding protein 1C